MNLSSNRLILRQAIAADASDIYAYRSDSEINQFLSSEPKSVAETEQFITNSAKELDEPGTWFQIAIVFRETNKVIGDIGLHFIDSEPHVQVEIGYTLSKTHQKQGIASEALREVIQFLFSNLKKHRITASVDPINEPSLRLLERLGFRKEAHFKKSLFFKGEWVDDVVYGLLEEEWSIRRNA